MIVKVKSASTSKRLTTLTQVKSALEIGTTDDDNYLETLIDQASDMVSRYCDRAFPRQTYEEQIGGTGLPRLMLTYAPIQAINQITRDGTTISSTAYEIENAEAGFVWYKGERWNQRNYSNQGIVAQPTRFKRLDYTVEYEAGYTLPGSTGRDLPESLEASVLEVIKWWYSERTENPNVHWQEVGETRETKYDRQTGDRVLPPKVEVMLKPFVRVDIP